MKKFACMLGLIFLALPAHAQTTLYSNSSTGDVGIGTTSPQSELEVYGGEVQIGSSGASCASANAGALRYSSGSIYACDGSNWNLIGGSSGGVLPSLSSADLWIGNASNAATAVALSGDCSLSNAGVITCTKTNGTSFGSLATQSSVNLSSQATGTLQAGQFPALTGDVTTSAGSLSTTVSAIQGNTVSGTTGTGDVVFSASPTVSGTVSGTNSNWSGSVGIGTSNPIVALDIVGGFIDQYLASGNNQGLTLQTGDSSNTYVRLENSTGIADFIMGNGSTNFVSNGSNPMFFYTDSYPRIYISGSGDVGVDTTSPAATLDVNGTVHVGTFASSSSTTVCQNGNVLSSCSSALHFKTNIRPSEIGLNEVLRMKPVTFDFKDHKDNWEKHDFGFIAEDMEKIDPVFVTYDERGELEGVRYMQLTAVNAKAIQELYEIIRQQQDEIEELKRTVEQYKH